LNADAVFYRGFRYPAEIISHCVWLCYRFPLSFREVEEMMHARGWPAPTPGCIYRP
jgi:putative transposase